SLGGQALDDPGVAGGAAEAETVVHPVAAALPELDAARLDEVAAPVVGPRRVLDALVLGLELGEAPLDRVARLDHLRLRARRRRDPRGARALGERGVGLLGAELDDFAVDDHLALLLVPG